jgi:glyoxylase-like metal-dependent hydrolase (beta-lactamase superfamily II)
VRAVRSDLSDAWFTVEELPGATYAISEYGHWEQPHAYLIVGDDRAALVDSGLGIGDISAVIDRVTELPITVPTTHAHWDHIGGHKHFDDIAVHEDDAGWVREGVRRKAYDRHGEWVDGVLFGLVREDLEGDRG